MAYTIVDDVAGMPPIAAVVTAPFAPAYVGMEVDAQDPNLGGGSFLVLPGAAGIVVGSLVTWNPLTKALALASTGSTGLPVAVAMAAVGAGQWGYFQIRGNALIAKTAAAIALGAGVSVSATGGQVVSGTLGAAGSVGACTQAAAAADSLVNTQIMFPKVL